MKLESKIGKKDCKDEQIYNFLTNFDNLKSLVPQDKIKDWQSNKDSCSFTVDPVGKTGFKIIDKEPFKLIKLTSLDKMQYSFQFWIQLKELSENETAIKLTMDVDINPMMAMMAKGPIKKFLDTLVERMEQIDYSASA
jgi:carbon monoxide dehydrogenase subunit G